MYMDYIKLLVKNEKGLETRNGNIQLGHRKGARGLMVIVIGNGQGDKSSNPGRDWLQFL